MSRCRAGAKSLCFVALASCFSIQAQTNLLIPRGSLWRYSDLNQRLSETWMMPSYDDSRWTLGAAPLGYGEPNVSLLRETMTAYFRRTFTLTNMPDSWLTLGVRRDDGIIVYINGVEVSRNNMPTGIVQHMTAALTTVEPTNFLRSIIGAWNLVPGINVLAAEVHQDKLDSPDLFFDLELFATNGGPRLAITSPTNNAAARTGTDLLLEALAEPVEGMASVDFYRNNNFIGRAAAFPFQVLWTSVPAGDHLLRAVATTRDGVSFDSAPILVQVADNFFPTGSITKPAYNATLGTRDTTIEAAVSDRDGTVILVEFFVDGIKIEEDKLAPFSVLWTAPLEGDHALMARVTDDSNLSINTPIVPVRVVDNVPPTGAITAPGDNETFASGDITISATASDPDGTVALVEFFANGNKVGEDTSPPYLIVWKDALAGDYAITARITDNRNLSANTPAIQIHLRFSGAVPRGPYLQMGTPTSVIVKWRTAIQTDSVVRYGTDRANLSGNATVEGLRSNHEVALGGLAPNTRYYYTIGSSSGASVSGPDLFFVTAPAGPKPTRIWVIGDSGTGSSGAAAVYNEYLNYTANRYTDLWLMLGDNAYDSGQDFEYQRGLFDMYPRLLAQTVVWPTIGNHDASPAYFDIFTLPRNGEAGGLATGVENYYSFNYSDIHFICLAGYYSGSLNSNGSMCTWLKMDLAANTSKWTIAYWHQPPYSKGSHNSDAEYDLVEMRENAVPLLESYGVDLVLCGHSHSYERSFLARGHYGFSPTLDRATMLLDQGSGRVDDTGPYVKRVTGPKAHHGTVYVVNGVGGQVGGGGIDHPIMYTGHLRMGSLVLDIDDDTLNATFLNNTGAIDDYFTITKRAPELRIVAFTHDAGACTISWASVAGSQYDVEYATGAAGPWATLEGPITATSSRTTVTHPTSSSAAFYRVLELD